MNTNAPHQHLATVDLFRLFDDELEQHDRASTEQALDACDVCRENALRLRQRTARLSFLLDEADWPAPPVAEAVARLEEARRQRQRARWNTTPSRLRIAAAIALVILGGALVVTPAAAWLGKVAERAWHAITSSTEPPAVSPQHESTTSGTTHRYVPGAGVLSLRFTTAAPSSVDFSISDDATFVLSVNGAPARDVLLLEHEVRIDNSTQNVRTYQVVVPRQVPAVRLFVGDADPTELTREVLRPGIRRQLNAR